MILRMLTVIQKLCLYLIVDLLLDGEDDLELLLALLEPLRPRLDPPVALHDVQHPVLRVQLLVLEEHKW